MKKPNIKYPYPTVCITVLFVLFLALASYIYGYPVNSFDIKATAVLQSQGWLSFLLITNHIITSQAFRLIYVFLVIIFLIKKRFSGALLILLAPATELLSYAIKEITLRPRPVAESVAVYDPTHGFSFVSGHTLEYTVFFVLLGLFITAAAEGRRSRYVLTGVWRILAGFSFLMPLVVGLGRVYAGAHWLTDIIGSYLLAAIILIIVVHVFKREFLTRMQV